MIAPPRIELRDVGFAYSRDTGPALDSVSLSVVVGELVGVLGPNGSGKSTLVRLMAGLERATSGQVLVDGRVLSAWSRSELSKKLAFVPQRDEASLDASVLETVLLGRMPHLSGLGFEQAPDREIALASLRECGALELSHRRFASLSGGEQKRVTMARALAQQTGLLLLDEPAAFLDIHHQVALLDVVRARVDRGECGCVLVVHDLNLASQYCDRLVLLDRGRVLAQGTVQDVMTYRRVSEAFRVDVYVGVNELSGTRYFVPMRGSSK